MKRTFGFQVKFSAVIILSFLGFNNLFNAVVSRATKQLDITKGQETGKIVRRISF